MDLGLKYFEQQDQPLKSARPSHGILSRELINKVQNRRSVDMSHIIASEESHISRYEKPYQKLKDKK